MAGSSKRNKTKKLPNAEKSTAEVDLSDAEKSPAQHSITSDAEDEEPITKGSLKRQLENLLIKVQSTIEATINKLQSSLDSVSLVANNALKLAEQLESKLKIAEIKINNLTEANKELKTQSVCFHNNLKQLEERVEERTNRQLRKTLVFRGIPEKQPPTTNLPTTNDTPSPAANQPTNTKTPTIKKQREDWTNTEALVADQIAAVCNVSQEQAASMLERVHRAPLNPHYKGNAPRPIFTALYDWKDSEFCLEKFRNNNVNNKDSKIYCEQKYGTITTKRRNAAMAERKALKEKGETVAGYVAYPARLMVKTSFRKGSNYFLKKDFSNAPIGMRD